MKIRSEQMEALSRVAYKDFEDRMVVSLGEAFPRKCKELGEEDVRALIRKGVDKARFYGFETEQDASQYITTMFLLGEDFDHDSELPWAGAILNEQPEDPEEKMDRLFEETIEYLGELDSAKK